MSGRAHVPHPPIDTLSGRWVIERAEPGEVSTVHVGNADARLRTWALTVRHAETNAVDHVRCRAVPRTEFRAGQEVEGRIVRNREGVWFRRDRPTTGRARG